MSMTMDDPEMLDALSEEQAPQTAAPEQDKFEAILKEKKELQELLLRRQAEFENFRRRTDKERLENAEYAAMDAVKAFLPVLDDFERALAVECADKEYARGMELIYQRTLETLKKAGLEPMSALGEKFDPNIHHAIELVPAEDAEPDMVLGEYQKGYFFKGRLLRPAMVKVSQ
jgi:molecular chaperone GrpE